MRNRHLGRRYVPLFLAAGVSVCGCDGVEGSGGQSLAVNLYNTAVGMLAKYGDQDEHKALACKARGCSWVSGYDTAQEAITEVGNRVERVYPDGGSWYLFAVDDQLSEWAARLAGTSDVEQAAAGGPISSGGSGGSGGGGSSFGDLLDGVNALLGAAAGVAGAVNSGGGSSYGNTDYSSYGRRVPTTYGQGSGTPQRTSQSTITGLGR